MYAKKLPDDVEAKLKSLLQMKNPLAKTIYETVSKKNQELPLI